MNRDQAITIIKKTKESLNEKKIDYARLIDEFKQVEAVKKRLAGKKFTVEEHIRGFVYAQISNGAPWKNYATRLENINEIFMQFDPEKLSQKEPDKIVQELKTINCAYVVLNKQSKQLTRNIKVIQNYYNTFEQELQKYDPFIDNGKKLIDWIRKLSETNSPFKLKEMGIALVCEYLRNVGIAAMKPDRHLLRIGGMERLGILPSIQNEKENNTEKLLMAQKEFLQFARLISEDPSKISYYDNILWLFGAKGYGEICTKYNIQRKEPKCYQCQLVPFCNFQPKTNR
jgi:hypothetical protein